MGTTESADGGTPAATLKHDPRTPLSRDLEVGCVEGGGRYNGYDTINRH